MATGLNTAVLVIGVPFTAIANAVNFAAHGQDLLKPIVIQATLEQPFMTLVTLTWCTLLALRLMHIFSKLQACRKSAQYGQVAGSEEAECLILQSDGMAQEV